jgi:hypothetical protein
MIISRFNFERNSFLNNAQTLINLKRSLFVFYQNKKCSTHKHYLILPATDLLGDRPLKLVKKPQYKGSN